MKKVFGKHVKWFFLLLVFVSCKQKIEVEQISINTFFKDADKSVFNISPDGKHISFLQPYNGKLNIFVQSLNGDSATRITSETDQSIQKYLWAGNNYILYVLDRGYAKNVKLQAVSTNGKKKTNINIKSTTKVEFLGNYKDSNKEVLLALNERNTEVFDVYRVNLETGEKKIVEKNPGNILSWIADSDQKIRLAIGSEGTIQTLLYREHEHKKFKVVKSWDFKSTLQPVGIRSKKDHIYALSSINRDKIALVELNCLTGEESKVIYENPHGDVTDVMYFKSLKRIVYVNTEIEKREVHFLDGNIAEVYFKIKEKLKGEKFKVVSSDNQEKFVVLRSFTDKSPGAYYLYSIKENILTKLADINSGINSKNMATQKPIYYKNREGVRIQGFLTLPQNKNSRNLPIVVIPHGGPYTKVSWGYSDEVQFLANRGYAVFQMNFRGSTGFGTNFKISGYKQWGTNIHNDITDGVKWLINQRIADKDKIAIYGHGFGGLAALNQMIYNPDLYACVISNAGFNNLFSYVKGIPSYFKLQEKMISEMIGDPEKDIEYLKYSSPIFHTNKISKPLLIQQGGKDPKVNLSETNQFVKELRKRKVEVKYILNENEGYFISDVNNKITFYKALERFLNENLKPDE